MPKALLEAMPKPLPKVCLNHVQNIAHTLPEYSHETVPEHYTKPLFKPSPELLSKPSPEPLS